MRAALAQIFFSLTRFRPVVSIISPYNESIAFLSLVYIGQW